MNSVSRIALVGLLLASSSGYGEKPDTATVSYRQVATTYAADGVVEAVKQSTVAAQISGHVTEVNFRVGDYVRQGQVIVRIDESQVSQQAAGSRAQAAAARAVLENARLNLDRHRQLVSRNFVSKAALDRAEAEFRAAEANFRAAEAASSQAATTRGYATVSAPYSGVVSAVHVEVGDTAFPGKLLMSGFDPEGLRVLATLPQARLALLDAGQLPRIEIPAVRQWIAATRQTLLPLADARSLSTQIRLDLPAKTRGVLPGMFARVHFVTGQARKLLVPAAAVLRRSEVTAVYVVDDRQAVQLRQVRLGDVFAEGVEVLAGLKPGEQVALDPVQAGLQAQ